jgi:ABC-type branched-subunit amino acid transport system permease subunit
MQQLKISILSILALILNSIAAFAQDTTGLANNTNNIKQIPMADILYENGKIYLVVLVLLTIFAGIIIFMARLDNKITKLENSYPRLGK